MGFRTKKSLGQHFLTDKNVIAKILDSLEVTSNDRLIEIGPGTGALTKWLYERYPNLQVIEIDERAIEVLRSQLPDLTIHQKDVLKVNWKKLATAPADTHVIGNLPYYITSPILFDLFEAREHLVQAVVMMQKEVAERLVASPSGKTYGILSVQTQLFSSPEILFDVSANSFSPPPKVVSSVVRLRFDKPTLPCSDKDLKKVVRTAFNQRRKKLSNALKPVFCDDLPDGFNYDQRAENWEPDIYADLAACLGRDDA